MTSVLWQVSGQGKDATAGATVVAERLELIALPHGPFTRVRRGSSVRASVGRSLIWLHRWRRICDQTMIRPETARTGTTMKAASSINSV
jgi:hypothetical protein